MWKDMESAKRCPREVNLLGRTRILLGSCSNPTLDQRFGVEKLGFCQTRGHGATYIRESVLDWGIGYVLHLIYNVFYPHVE
jgi:hypothetical protein